MTKEEKLICDKCGDKISPECKEVMDMAEPYVQIEITSEGMQLLASSVTYPSDTFHFHNDCFEISIFEKLKGEE